MTTTAGSNSIMAESKVSSKKTTGSSIQAILWDLDGTLLDTEVLSDKAMWYTILPRLPNSAKEIAETLSYKLPWDLKRQILGLRGSEWGPIVLTYAEKHWDLKPESMSVSEIWSTWERNLDDLCREVKACPGALQLVQAFAKEYKLPMAIATSSRMDAANKKLQKHLGIKDAMSAIVCGDDPAVKSGKPAPDIYFEAAKRLNVSPTKCLVFEDALTGVEAGKAAGCSVVAIPDPRLDADGRATFEELADVVLGSLFEFEGTMFQLKAEFDQEK